MTSTLISCNNSVASAICELSRGITANTFYYRVIGYTPNKAPMGNSSLIDAPGIKKMVGSCGKHVVIPKGAIIDRIEFAGYNDFSVQRMDIGLGTFNNPINFPLIINATAAIANEPIGGIRDFKFEDMSGAADHVMVARDSYINVSTTGPISGDLQVTVYYHTRKIPIFPE